MEKLICYLIPGLGFILMRKLGRIQDEKEKDFRTGMPGAEFLLKCLQIAYWSLCKLHCGPLQLYRLVGINDCLSSKHKSCFITMKGKHPQNFNCNPTSGGLSTPPPAVKKYNKF
ncbi:hypothetical protein Ahy_B05g078887 isoform G [Arachis hypogaea]|uniref:Uncharacterized protein n=1 Tax=Arachis hypogaea TaxID=3818 RepID=A0A444Z8F4_ARAHY|nr:hypothetical protein Ahy_B05g078887 isoform G [Arachis hypogaea]